MQGGRRLHGAAAGLAGLLTSPASTHAAHAISHHDCRHARLRRWLDPAGQPSIAWHRSTLYAYFSIALSFVRQLITTGHSLLPTTVHTYTCSWTAGNGNGQSRTTHNCSCTLHVQRPMTRCSTLFHSTSQLCCFCCAVTLYILLYMACTLYHVCIRTYTCCLLLAASDF